MRPPNTAQRAHENKAQPPHRNKRFDLDTLRVSNRSPTPISKSDDFLGQSDDIWGAHFRPILGVPGARADLTNTYFLGL